MVDGVRFLGEGIKPNMRRCSLDYVVALVCVGFGMVGAMGVDSGVELKYASQYYPQS